MCICTNVRVFTFAYSYCMKLCVYTYVQYVHVLMLCMSVATYMAVQIYTIHKTSHMKITDTFTYARAHMHTRIHTANGM